jgi:hypothetical protein
MWSEEERRLEGRGQVRLETNPDYHHQFSVTACPGSSAAHQHMLSLSLPSSRTLALRSLFSSNVLARHFAGATLPTRRDTDTVDRAQPTSNNSMDQITDILDDADLSASPRSNNFSGKPLVPPPVNSPHLVFLAP